MSSKTCKSKRCNPQESTRRLRSANNVSPGIVTGCQELVFTSEDFDKYRKSFLENIERGLAKSTNEAAIIKCFPTYVQALPDGSEAGQYLGLDLGGSNFRVIMLMLGAGGVEDEKQKNYVIPDDVLIGTSDQLFDFIAECLADFVKEYEVADANLPLGFTFSFPCTQKGLRVGILRRWTKGFSVEGVPGQDAVDLLDQAIKRRDDVKIEIVAILNDTTGTLLSAGLTYPDARIGLIVATGTNACYMEDQSKAELFDEPDSGSGKVIINLESGAFGDDGALDFVKTKYDEIVDERSLNKGQQTHEKMIAGLYLGELVRLTAERFTKEGLLFGGKGSDKLFTIDSIHTSFLSDIESEPYGTYKNIKEICDQLDLTDATEQDYNDLRYICECFSTRAAHLVSGQLSVLIEKINEPKIIIGVDGTLYKNHPNFKGIMVEKTRELVKNQNLQFEIVLAEDGSGRGAAIAAAVAHRLAN